MADPEDFAAAARAMTAARKGCAECGGPVRVPPAGDPFSTGPFIGRYRCADCWTLYWAQHPDDLADEETYEYVCDQAAQIQVKRGSEILFQDGANRVYLSYRGTLVFDIRPSAEHAQNEYDPDRFNELVRAIKAVSGKVAGYSLEPAVSA